MYAASAYMGTMHPLTRKTTHTMIYTANFYDIDFGIGFKVDELEVTYYVEPGERGGPDHPHSTAQVEEVVDVLFRIGMEQRRWAACPSDMAADYRRYEGDFHDAILKHLCQLGQDRLDEERGHDGGPYYAGERVTVGNSMRREHEQ